ncbi:hypothetical protein [Arthrobacter sp. 4R501]|uniref:hypothetical protein n=1 Tax=Arthrobacter sp. 4R501 TaxID=2058886 RepID=UPI0034D3D32D
MGIFLCGGGDLAGHLLPEIDRLILKRNPIALAAGVPLFGGVTFQPASFHAVSARRFASGVVIEEYERVR